MNAKEYGENVGDDERERVKARSTDRNRIRNREGMEALDSSVANNRRQRSNNN